MVWCTSVSANAWISGANLCRVPPFGPFSPNKDKALWSVCHSLDVAVHLCIMHRAHRHLGRLILPSLYHFSLIKNATRSFNKCGCGRPQYILDLLCPIFTVLKFQFSFFWSKSEDEWGETTVLTSPTLLCFHLSTPHNIFTSKILKLSYILSLFDINVSIFAYQVQRINLKTFSSPTLIILWSVFEVFPVIILTMIANFVFF